MHALSRGKGPAITLALMVLALVAPSAQAAITFEGTFGKPPNEDGTLAEDSLHSPYDIAVDPDTGEIFVVDNYAFRILKYDKDRKFLMSIGEPGTSSGHDGPGQLYYPQSIALDPSGEFLFVADTFNSRIQVFTTADGGFYRMWGTQGSGDNQLNHPGGIAIDREGNVYVADTRNHRIMKFTSSGTFIKKWGAFGSAEGQFNTPVGIDIERGNEALFVTEDVGRVQRFDLNGGFASSFGLGASGVVLSNPDEISVFGIHAYVVESGGEGDGHEVSVIDVIDGELEGEFKGSDAELSDYGFGPHGIGFNTQTRELLVAAGGSVNKIWSYSTGLDNIELNAMLARTDGVAINNKSISFIVHHNMMIGSCLVKGSGELRTPDNDPVLDRDLEGKSFELEGPNVRVGAKRTGEFRVRLSDKAAEAAKKSRAKGTFEFKASCRDTGVADLEQAKPKKIRFTL